MQIRQQGANFWHCQRADYDIEGLPDRTVMDFMFFVFCSYADMHMVLEPFAGPNAVEWQRFWVTWAMELGNVMVIGGGHSVWSDKLGFVMERYKFW